MNPDYELIKNPNDLKRLQNIKSHIFKKIKNLDVTISKSHEPVPYDKRQEGQNKIRRGTIWGHMFDSAWFHFTSDIPENVKGKKLVTVLDTMGEGLIVDEGNIAKQGTSHIVNIISPSEIFNPPVGKTFYRLPQNTDSVDIWMDAGYNGVGGYNVFYGKLKQAYLAQMDEDIYRFYFDYLCLAWASHIYKEERKKQVRAALDKAYSLYKKGEITKASAILNEQFDIHSKSDLEFSCVGHSHLDLAWLWPMRETKRKAARTLSTAVKNMKLYPEYVYGASQPQEFVWIKENYPDLFNELKALHDKGQFEVQGGMWVECDTNITGGESLIRQFLYGMKYWEDEFNDTVNNCWLPDVFGYSAALPQIIKKCGIDYFMTQKLSWNNYNDFPLQTFNWKGLSDDSVLVHLLPANGYDTSCHASKLKLTEERHRRKDKVCKEALICFGAGDGGGGPCECDIEFIKHYRNLEGLPKLKFSKAQDLFDKLGTYKDELPDYKGELYLEKHQGTYTTQSDIKKHNRMCEHLMHTYEALSSAAVLKGYEYPKEKVDELWKNILLFQFHDILPGSSVTRVNVETNARYKEMIIEINTLISDVLNFLKTDENKTLSVYNPSPFSQKGYISKDNKLYSYDLKAYEAAELKEENKCNFDLHYSEDTLENDILKVSFDKYGAIKSVVEKLSNKEFSKDGLNKLHIYKDKKLFFNAWDIDIDYTKKAPQKLKLVSSKAYAEGDSVIRENIYKYNKSTLKQNVILRAGVPYAEFDTYVDWHETHKMLRADFYPAVYSDEVECDIQFGNIKRSTKTDNKINWAQFEICAHKYVDVSDDNFGSSVITDSKYGYRVKDGLISLNLLRSPVYPDKKADRGEHHFKYCYYPHVGNSKAAQVIKESYNYNFKPLFVNGSLNLDSLVSVDNSNIVVETLKPSESGDSIVLRLYESSGTKQNAELKINSQYNEIFETDMRERNAQSVDKNLNFDPFEIKTIAIK